MGIIWFLIAFPLVAAALCLVARNERFRAIVVCVSAVVIAAASIWLASGHLSGPEKYYEFSSEVLGIVFLVVELALCGYVIWRAIMARKYAILALACLQALLVCVLDFWAASGVEVESGIYIDTLSAIMVLIIGIIGSGICVYAVGYMHDFQHHQAELAERGEEFATDRQTLFFAVMLAFLSAMFGIVLFNSLAWLLCMWEVTTVCSFFLIGYTRTREATENAFRQIWMNLIGGIAFTLALIYIGSNLDTMELDRFVEIGLATPKSTMLPLALLALAALTKAAQMPFHTWLLGAMVAPTPTSALLHSSTMVKAGVFLLIRLSPLMGTYLGGAAQNSINPAGIAVMLVGGTTFLLASMIAVSQSNAKRVLAYSTIANLGLIVTCAGIGSTEAIWAAMFLLVFHACAKSLLFLCVGTAEHHIGSRNIESMDALISRMPRLACLMALGICGMFVAPFGMLISKWAALGAFVDSGVLLLVVMLVFGSAATFFFWAKWLAKIMGSRRDADNVEAGVHGTEWCALGVMAALVAICSVGLPWISSLVVAPYAESLISGTLAGPGMVDLAVMAVVALVMLLVPGLFALRAKSLSRGDGHQPIFGGVGMGEGEFLGALSSPVRYEQRNWYLEGIFDENRLGTIGTIICLVIAAMGIACAFAMSLNFLGSVI